MADNRKHNGGKREGSGRKPKAFEKTIKEYTDPYLEEALATILEVMRKGKKDSDRYNAAKTLLEYNWGKPKQQTDITSNGESVNIPLSSWADDK